MSVVLTAFPIYEHHAEMATALKEATARVHDKPGTEFYTLHEGHDRLAMIEKYESRQARSEHAKGAALAGLRSALPGKLRSRCLGSRAAPGRNAQEDAL